MRQVLEKGGFIGAAVVVTRYFGGTLLGTGGLVRAYTGACRAVVDVVDWVEAREGTQVIVSGVPAAAVSSLYRLINDGPELELITEVSFDSQGCAEVELWVPEDGVARLCAQVEALARGQVSVSIGSTGSASPSVMSTSRDQLHESDDVDLVDAPEASVRSADQLVTSTSHDIGLELSSADGNSELSFATSGGVGAGCGAGLARKPAGRVRGSPPGGAFYSLKVDLPTESVQERDDQLLLLLQRGGLQEYHGAFAAKGLVLDDLLACDEQSAVAIAKECGVTKLREVYRLKKVLREASE